MPSTTPAGIVVFALLVTGATYRLTVLAVRDKITEPIRHWVQRRAYGSLVNYFTKCPWCISVWIGSGVTVAADTWWMPVPWLPAALVAATASAVTGILFEKV